MFAQILFFRFAAIIALFLSDCLHDWLEEVKSLIKRALPRRSNLRGYVRVEDKLGFISPSDEMHPAVLHTR